MSVHQDSQGPAGKPEREYEKSGLYPENDKPFRVFALLGWLVVIIAALAGISALLDTFLL